MNILYRMTVTMIQIASMEARTSVLLNKGVQIIDQDFQDQLSRIKTKTF